jgi:hypothetical protein
MRQYSQLVVTGFGAQATAALKQLLRTLKSDDALAPVDVVVPSAIAGVTARRAVADPGLANVRFSSFAMLAQRLAVRELARLNVTVLSSSERLHALRVAVAGSSGRLAQAARHPATITSLNRVFAELDDADTDIDSLDNLDGSGRGGAEVAALYRSYLKQIEPFARPVEVLRAAGGALSADSAPATTIVLFAPRMLSGAERRLLQVLAEQNRLAAVVCLSGDPAADTETNAIAEWLGTLLLRCDIPLPDDQHQTTTLEIAPDAEEEVRLAIRRVLHHLALPGTQPHRVALAYRTSVPYARLLGEQLAVAGLAHHVPSQRTLAGSVTGRMLLGLLELHARGFPRGSVLRWLADGPLIDANGSALPISRWDRLSREAGISSSLQTWHQRLDQAAGLAKSDLETITEGAPDAARTRSRHTRRIDDCHALRGFLDDISAACDAVASARTWAAASDALHVIVRRFLGGRKTVAHWGSGLESARWAHVEQFAYSGVLAVLDSLADLDGAEVSADTVQHMLRQELDRPLPNGTVLGRGVMCGPVREFAGADLDLLIVLGMTEDAFPPRLSEDPLLGDSSRKQANCGLALLADRRRMERYDYVAAAAGASRLVLCCPRADTRAQRAQHPSPWFMEALSQLNGGPVKSAAISGMHADWLSQHDSFEASLRNATTALSSCEFDIGIAMGADPAPLADADPRYARARDAVLARRDGAFDAWTGQIGPLPESLADRIEAATSATSLETWATCPRRFWLDRMLKVRDLDDPGDGDTIEPRDKGTLVHEVLESFFANHLGQADRPGRDPELRWTTAEITNAQSMLNDRAALLEASGRTGRPLLWAAQKARLHRQVSRILAVDSTIRAGQRSWPVGVEQPFGRSGVPPLELTLPRSGPVRFAGSIDRIDATEDGGLVVIDYKTGTDRGYSAIPNTAKAARGSDDLVDGGRKLQLILYGLAARAHHGSRKSEVQAYYWFVEHGRLCRGGPIDQKEEARLLDVLDVIVSGVRGGIYPANPGKWDQWGGWSSCHFCPYDRVCPSSRGEAWQSARAHPDVAPYAALASDATELVATEITASPIGKDAT